MNFHVVNFFLNKNKCSNKFGFIIIFYIQAEKKEIAIIFTDKYTLKPVYSYFVRQILNYDSSLVTSQLITSVKSLYTCKKTQKFLRLFLFKSNMSLILLLNVLDLETLEKRQSRLDVYFLNKLNVDKFIVLIYYSDWIYNLIFYFILVLRSA